MQRFQSLYDYPQLYKHHSGENRLTLAMFLRVPDNQVLKQALFQHEEERRDSDLEEGQETR